MSDPQLDSIRQGGIPKATQKQTQCCILVWKEWAAYQQNMIIEQSETAHWLLVNFVEISEADIQHWLEKFVAEAK